MWFLLYPSPLSCWCDAHFPKSGKAIHDVAFFDEEASKRTITVCRDTTAAALIGLRAMLVFKARDKWVKAKESKRGSRDKVGDFNPDLGLWTRNSCLIDPDSGDVVIGRLNKAKDNFIVTTVSMSKLYEDAGWSMPCHYVPGMHRTLRRVNETETDGGSRALAADPGHHACTQLSVD